MPYWIGVASKDHVELAIAGSFCQLGHGKSAPLRRLSPGDWLIFYSPRTQLKGGNPIQSFTAIGQIQPGEPYTCDMGGGFVPARRDVRYFHAHDASIRPLIDRLSFITNKSRWAAPFRFGLVKITRDDTTIIAEAMGIDTCQID